MIYFLNASGGLAHCLPESVYQGSAEGNTLFLVAPVAASAEVYAAFCLPDGSVTPRYRLEYAGSLSGYAGETGQAVCGWSLSLPASVTVQYGTVRVQFYIFAEGKKQAASAAAQFTVERGVESELPSAPDEDTYENISAALAALRADLINGYYPARASVAWNDGHVYGANELVFYPDTGKYGAILRSKVQNNVQKPYTDGALNADFWEIVVHFDTIAEEYFDELSEILSQGSAAVAAETEKAQAAQKAAENAKTAAETAASEAETAKNNAEDAAAQAGTSASAAQGSAGAAASSASLAEESATRAAQAETAAENAAQTAQAQAGAAAGSAQTAGEHAQDAEEFAELAQRYAEIGIQPNTDYSSLDELPRPGSTKFIYMIPNSNTESVDSYSEYLWVPDKSDYEFIGSTKIDLTDYAKQNGTYSDLTAGKAVRLSQSVKFQATNSAGGQLGWFKLATVSGAKLAAINGNSSYSATLLINGINEPALSFGGIVEIDCRIESSQIVTDSNRVQPKILCGGLREEYICAVPNTETNELDVYFLINSSYAGYSVTVIDEGYTRLMQPSETAITLAGTFYNAEAPSGAVYAVNVNSAATAEMLSSTQLQSADDLNNLYGSEYYGKNFWWAGNGYPINAPYNSGGYLQVNNIAGYTLQAAYIFSVKSDNNIPTEYQRVKGQNGVWSEWEEIATSEGTYPNLTAGAADRLSRRLYIGVGTGTSGWYKVGSLKVSDILSQSSATNTTSSFSMLFLVTGLNANGINQTGVAHSGVFELECRMITGAFADGYTNIKILAGDIRAEDYCYAMDTAGSEITLYCNLGGTYMATDFCILSEQYGSYATKAFTFDGTFESAEMPSGGTVGINVSRAAYDAAGNDISETYAKQSGTYPDMTAGKAGKAEGDVRGTAIAENYVKVSSSRGTVSFFLGNIAVNVTLSVSNLTVDSLSVGDCVLANVTVLGTEYVVLLKMMSVSSESSGMGKVCAFGVTSSFNSSGTYSDLTAGDAQKINGLEIAKDESGVLKIGNTVIPQKINILKQAIYCVTGNNFAIPDSETGEYFSEMLEEGNTYEVQWARLNDSNEPIETFCQVASVDTSKGYIILTMHNIGLYVSDNQPEMQLQACRVIYFSNGSQQVQLSPIHYYVADNIAGGLQYHKSAVLKINKIVG